MGAAFEGDYPLWWNTTMNNKHFSSQCTVCDNTFVAYDFNLHQCVMNGTVAKIDMDRAPPVKRAPMPKIKRESVAHIPIETLSDAPSRRRFVKDSKFMKMNYACRNLFKRKSDMKNGKYSKRMKKNENASGDQLTSINPQMQFFSFVGKPLNNFDRMLD